MHAKLRVASLSIGGNAALVSAELGIAFVTGSLSVLADAFHSGVDLTGSVIAFWGISLALRRADRSHAYGYGRYENASALIQFVLIAVIGVTILVEAFRRAMYGFTINVSEVAILATLITIGVDLLLYRYIARAGRALGSSALEADSYHFGTDAIGKVAVLVGIGMAYLGYPFMDLVGATLIAVAFLLAAFVMGRKNLQVLVDASPNPELLDAMRKTVVDIPGVVGVHSLRARSSGSHVLVDLCVHAVPEMPLDRAHSLAHDVEDRLRTAFPEVSEVVVHVEPTNHPSSMDQRHRSSE